MAVSPRKSLPVWTGIMILVLVLRFVSHGWSRIPRRPAAPERLMPAASPLAAQLTQMDSGPGVLVCEPVATGADRTAADFGAGCGRWLHLIVAGHGELGKTPSWFCADYARRELH